MLRKITSYVVEKSKKLASYVIGKGKQLASLAFAGATGVVAYASSASAVGTFVIDTAPAVTDITAAGIAIIAVSVVVYSFRRVNGILGPK